MSNAKSIETIYTIPVPYSMNGTVIEVYGCAFQGWYEWRIILPDGKIQRDTKDEGHTAFEGIQYGCPEIALRDALIFVTK